MFTFANLAPGGVARMPRRVPHNFLPIAFMSRTTTTDCLLYRSYLQRMSLSLAYCLQPR